MPYSQIILKDMHLPETIAWWPPALGWWLLLLILLFFGLLCIYLYKRVSQKTAIKTAIKLLLDLKQEPKADDLHILMEISILMRRAAISLAPRVKVASLTGKAWLQYLDSSIKGNPFTQGQGRFLVDAHYQKTLAQDLDIILLLDLCVDWLQAQTKIKNNKI